MSPDRAPVMPVGTLIRHHRRRKGLRLSDLGEQVDACTGRISRWERGHEFIPLSRRVQIAAVLGLDPARLAEPEAVAVTPDERRFLDALRRLPPAESEALRALVDEILPPETLPC